MNDPSRSSAKTLFGFPPNYDKFGLKQRITRDKPGNARDEPPR
jgi:hypothetical protein